MTDYVVLPPVEVVPAEVRQVTNGQTVAPGSMGAPRMALSEILSRAAEGHYPPTSVSREVVYDGNGRILMAFDKGLTVVDVPLKPNEGAEALMDLEDIRRTVAEQQQAMTNMPERNGYLMAVYRGDIKAGVDMHVHFGQAGDTPTCVDMGLGELTPDGHLVLKIEGYDAVSRLRSSVCWRVTVQAFGY